MFKHQFSFKLVSSSSDIYSSNHVDYEHMLKYMSFGKVSLQSSLQFLSFHAESSLQFLHTLQNFLAGLAKILRVKLITNNLLVTFELTQQELSRKTL